MQKTVRFLFQRNNQMKKKVIDYLPEFMQALEDQLKSDELQYGDTWKKKSARGQEGRIFDSIFAYYRDYVKRGILLCLG